jgi:hypothetical protein
MASEYTHQIEAQGKSGDWKPMTKHIGEADAKQSLASLKANPKSKGSLYRIKPMAAPANKPAAKPAAKAAPKAAAKPAAKPAAKKAAPKKDAK